MTPAEVTTFLRRYNEWRRTDDRYGLPYPDPREIGEAIDAAVEMIERLEAAEKAVTEAYQRGYATGQEEIEKERDALSALVVMRFDHDYPPQFTQGHDLHELTEPVTAEHCRWFVAEIERLRTDCDALRAKLEAMEKQEPVAWQTRTRPAWNDGTWGAWRKCSEEYAEDIKKTPSLHDWLYEARALYALPGAKGE